MSVYIKGMGIPTRGHMTIRIYADGTVEHEHTERKLGTAIHIPDHGRLGDLDVMCNECRRVAEEYDGIYPDCTYCPAHLAPTVIPAEEGEG